MGTDRVGGVTRRQVMGRRASLGKTRSAKSDTPPVPLDRKEVRRWSCAPRLRHWRTRSESHRLDSIGHRAPLVERLLDLGGVPVREQPVCGHAPVGLGEVAAHLEAPTRAGDPRHRVDHDVGLHEPAGDQPEADGVEASGTMQLTLHRVTIHQVRHALRLVERNRNLIVSDCHLYHNRGIGIFYDHVNLHQSNIVGCHISYNEAGGIVVLGGEVRNIHISGCDIESNMSAAHPDAANVLLDSRSGSVAEVSIVGCTIQHQSRDADTANIRVFGNGAAARNGMTDAQWQALAKAIDRADWLAWRSGAGTTDAIAARVALPWRT